MKGSTVSHYRILDHIGAGGMGDIYLAEDLTLPRRVALKFLSQHLVRDRRSAERFLREAKAASALDHPNICTIYEIGETEDGRMFIAMPFYEGRTIHSLLSHGPLFVADALKYAAGVAEGLVRAHAEGILHRDIKPGNLIVTRDGVVKILDFGLAKLTTQGTITASGAIMGTVPYMSPEQATGKPVDQRSDIFSLGSTLYEMTTGRSPFKAGNNSATIHRIVNENPEPPSTIREGVPPGVERIIRRAMEKAPRDRYQTMDDFRTDLVGALRELEPEPTVRFDLRGGRTRRLRWPLALAVLVLAAGAAVTVRYWDTVRDALGRGGTGHGVMVQFAGAGVDGGPRRLAAGTDRVLSSRVLDLARANPDLWVVPPRRAKEAEAAGGGRPASDFGAATVITAVPRGSRGDTLEVRVSRAAEGRVLRAFDLPVREPAAFDRNLTEHLAAALRLDRVPPDDEPGPSRIPAALAAYLAGLGYLEAGNADSAQVAFEQALAADTLCTDALVGLAEAWYARKSDPSRSDWATHALEACRQALARDDSCDLPYVWRGRIRSAQGDKEGALDDFRQAVSRNPRNADTPHFLGGTLVELGRMDEAESVYRDVIRNNPEFWGGYEDLGYLYYSQGRYDEAIREFQHVASLVPDYAPTYNYLGALHYSLEKWDDAIAMFEKSFALGRTYAACSNLGTLYYMKERFADAARMYEWAREYNASDYSVVGNLATACYWIPEERERSRQLFEEAIRLGEGQRKMAPKDAVLLSYLAGFYSIDHPERAAEDAEQALSMDPDNAEVLYRSALVYETVGKRARALVLLGDAIQRGYSLKTIASERQLKDLREDPRYELLVSKATGAEAG